MQQIIKQQMKKILAPAALTLVGFAAAALFTTPSLAAQQTGPLPPPPSYSAPASTPLPR